MFDLTIPGMVGLYIGAWGFSNALSRLVGSVLGGVVRDALLKRIVELDAGSPYSISGIAPRARIIVGGPAGTVEPQRVAQTTGCDHLVLGEGEESLPRLIARIEAGDAVVATVTGRL